MIVVTLTRAKPAIGVRGKSRRVVLVGDTATLSPDSLVESLRRDGITATPRGAFAEITLSENSDRRGCVDYAATLAARIGAVFVGEARDVEVAYHLLTRNAALERAGFREALSLVGRQ